MKSVSKVLLALLVACSIAPKLRAADADPVQVAPKNYHVRIDNRQVRVLDVWLRPGVRVPMHSHPDSVVYVVNGGLGKFTNEKGQSQIVRMHAGQCLWRNEEEHTVQNLGKTTIHVIQVELKGVRIF